MAATEVTSTYANAVGADPLVGHFGSVIDTALVLRAAATFTDDEQTTAINVEGGEMAIVLIVCGAVTGTTPTFQATVEASINAGSNYYDLILTPTITEGDIENSFVAFPVWIPKPSSERTVRVRLDLNIGADADEEFSNFAAYLLPMSEGLTTALEQMISFAI